MEKKHKVRQLLSRYLAGQAEVSEQQQVDQWYDAYEQREVQLDERKRQALADDMYRQVRLRTGLERKARVWRLPVAWRVAAALLLVSTIVVFLRRPAPANLHAWNTGAREQRHILLPDGTEVILQQASKITWKGDFKTGPRELELVHGQAFFKIAHNSARPFLLHLPNQLQIRVLGTSFSVEAIPEDPYIRIKMKTGRVALSKDQQSLGVLVRGQQLQFDRQASTALIKSEPVPVHLIRFDHTSLSQLAAQLENEYDVRINLPEEPNSHLVKCSGTFNSGQDVGDILQAVCLLHHFTLHLSPDQQTFTISTMKK